MLYWASSSVHSLPSGVCYPPRVHLSHVPHANDADHSVSHVGGQYACRSAAARVKDFRLHSVQSWHIRLVTKQCGAHVGVVERRRC